MHEVFVYLPWNTQKRQIIRFNEYFKKINVVQSEGETRRIVKVACIRRVGGGKTERKGPWRSVAKVQAE